MVILVFIAVESIQLALYFFVGDRMACKLELYCTCIAVYSVQAQLYLIWI